MDKQKILDVVTSIPFVTVMIIILTIAIYWVFLNPQYDYVLHSSVLTKDSYLKVDDNGNLKFSLSANLFPEIKKESTFQKELSKTELQRALLRKEKKLFKELELTGNKRQVTFDMSMWYIITSGINTNVNQLKEDRESRLLAGYYYLKVFNSQEPKNIATQKLAQSINTLLESRKKNREFYNDLTEQPSRNLETPLTPEEKKQEEVYKATFSKEEQAKNLSKLCKLYEKRAKTRRHFNKYAFLVGAKACYEELNDIEPDNEQYKTRLKVVSKQLKAFEFSPI